MILHCTAKLAGKLAVVAPAPLDDGAELLGAWHGHLVNIDRRQCVLFCHDATRYTLFLPGLRAPQFVELGRSHRDLFLATLAGLGLPPARLSQVRLALGPVRRDRTTNRSVLGTLNIVRRDLEGWLRRVENVMELDPLAVSMRLNERPVYAGRELLRPNQAMLRDLEGALP